MDAHRTAWDVFTRSIDKAELEKERMRAANLDDERFGSDAHKAQMWIHEVARVESRRALSFAHVPYRFVDWERTRG